MTRGKIHQFFGMVLDFTKAGECHVMQNDHVLDMIKGWPEDIDEKGVAITPAARSRVRWFKIRNFNSNFPVALN